MGASHRRESPGGLRRLATPLDQQPGHHGTYSQMLSVLAPLSALPAAWAGDTSEQLIRRATAIWETRNVILRLMARIVQDPGVGHAAAQAFLTGWAAAVTDR